MRNADHDADSHIASSVGTGRFDRRYPRQRTCLGNPGGFGAAAYLTGVALPRPTELTIVEETSLSTITS